MKPELIKEYRDVNFVYRVPSIDRVTLDLVEKEEWPDKAKALVFQLDSVGVNDYQALWKNIGDKYFSRMYYYAKKEDILVRKPERPCGSVKRHVFSGKEEMAEIYVRTIAEFFWKPWEKYVFGFYGKENSEKMISEQAMVHLEERYILAHEKEGEVVSFLAYKPLLEPVSGRNSDWILWVWISPKVKKEERAHIRAEFSGFLKNAGGNQWVVAATEPFNVRPNIFWQSIGFKLGCVGINIKK